MNSLHIQEKGNNQGGAMITPWKLFLTHDYIQEKGGILNALVFASAQYIYKVIEKETGRDSIKRFNSEKLKKLHRGILHKNAHLDEYFADLLFRSILPPYMKDLEIKEHTLISKHHDIFAKITWPNAVVFGIGKEDAGGSEALQIFDEHSPDGSRLRFSCSQLVAEEFFGQIPKAVQIVLDEVNLSDSKRGAHQYNLKNIFHTMHDTLFIVGYDEYNRKEITKYLTENWKRAIVDACIVAMIFCYQNNVYKNNYLDDEIKLTIEKATKKSLNYFLDRTLLKNKAGFEKVKGKFLHEFKIGNHDQFDKAVWRDQYGNEIGKQIMVINQVCYALEKSWGWQIGNFVMMHIWQHLFQQQILFEEIIRNIKGIPSDVLIETMFGSIRKIQIDKINFHPEKRISDTRKRTFKDKNPLWIIEANVINPSCYNTATVIKYLINNDYQQGGNNGFGLLILHDKIINAKIVNVGPTVPGHIWKVISDSILAAEPDQWFQLLDTDGNYADFTINRNKAHQEHLPSVKINVEYLRDIIEKL